MAKWGSVVEVETQRRILLSVAAYAYEFKNESFMSDHAFDEECKLVDLTIDTANPTMDAWFRKEFDPCTGQWVRKHPNLPRLETLYNVYTRS